LPPPGAADEGAQTASMKYIIINERTNESLSLIKFAE